MMKIISILLFLSTTLSVFGQHIIPTTKMDHQSFPTNINEGNFKNLEKYNGEIVAYDGIIERIENSRNNTPFYKLQISESNYLWTVLMFNNDKNKIGDKVRVVGYLKLTESNESEKKYLEGKFMVIVFGLVDFNNSDFLFLGGAEQQKQEWIDGKIPSAK